MQSYAAMKLKLRATVGGVEFRDVVQFASSFTMNQIPAASIVVAVGRRVSDDALATIHSAYDNITVQQVVQVFLRAEILGIENAIPGLPDRTELLIYEGKVVGTGWRRGTDGAQFTIHAIHWLADLDSASSISGSSHPGNPAAWTYPAAFRRLGPASGADAGGAGANTPIFVPHLFPDEITFGDLSDLWGSALHKRMLLIAGDDTVDRALIGGQPGGGNLNALAALGRMGPNADGVPLELETDGAYADILARSIRKAVNEDQGSNWINTTLWGKLIGDWAPSFMFSVIPRILDALIVPFTGGLQETWAVLGDEDYTMSDLNGQMNRLLRAVGILNPVLFGTGYDDWLAHDRTIRTGFCGYFQPAGIDQGMVMIKDPPRWLCDPMTAWIFAPASAGIAPVSPIETALDETGTGPPRTPDAPLETTQARLRSIMSRLAHQWYVLEMLKGRTGEVVGKLRFDIAPGSNIMLEAGHAKNVPLHHDNLAKLMFATVVSVSYMIDAENQRAGTGFSLAHMRNKQENRREGTSVEKPPLYAITWRGAKLIKNVELEGA